MRRFAELFAELDASTRTESKVQALVRWLAEAPAEDAAWGVYLLSGGKPLQTIPTAVLRETARAVAGLPEWLFDASYQAVGDLAETIAQVLPPPEADDELGLAAWMTDRLMPLRGAPPAAQAESLERWWRAMRPDARFLLTKLIGGGFRVGVSRALVQRAVAEHAQLDPQLVAQRMMGYTDAKRPPDATRWQALVAPVEAGSPQPSGQPYPFYLAHPLPAGWQPPGIAPGPALGDAALWQAEWKYDGIRAQLVRRAGRTWLWSRGEELMDGRFPEVEAAAAALPDGLVLDGELLVWPQGALVPAPFQQLQTRIQRKAVSRRLLAEAPVAFVAYDLLESAGADWRGRPLSERRQALETALQAPPAGQRLRLAPLLAAEGWDGWAAQRQQARAAGTEGLMLKHRAAPYGIGRTRAPGIEAGGWWKWKLDPLQVDGVLIYAQAGHGRRAGLYTDYTFAVWNRPPRDAEEAQAVVEAIARRAPPDPQGLQLVAFAKAYSGLSDDEFRAVDRVIRGSTLEKFGPVRSVRPSLVMTLGFEGIQLSRRHKSGLALRFPRMLALRPDKPLHEADTLDALRLLAAGPAGPMPGPA